MNLESLRDYRNFVSARVEFRFPIALHKHLASAAVPGRGGATFIINAKGVDSGSDPGCKEILDLDGIGRRWEREVLGITGVFEMGMKKELRIISNVPLFK